MQSDLIYSGLYLRYRIWDLITPLLIMFKLTLNELYICIMRHDFNQSDLHISNAVQYFEDDESGFVVTFSLYLRLVVYLDQNFKMSKGQNFQNTFSLIKVMI